MTQRSIARLSAAAVFLSAATHPALAATTLVGHIGSKAGPQNARVWSVQLMNAGPNTASAAQFKGFTLTQTSGAACTPVVTPPSSYPVALGDIGSGSSASAAFTVDFTGCPANASFILSIPYSADSGATTGTIVRYHQFR
ncbi:MAG: hypothetical protein ACHQQS_10965 [Thermoanaerobaculales bacterium]